VLVAFNVLMRLIFVVIAVSTLAEDVLRLTELVFAAARALSTLVEEPESCVEEVWLAVIAEFALVRAVSTLADEVARLLLSFTFEVMAAF